MKTAKDTVMPLEEGMNESLRIQMGKILQAQAEISFKAGIGEVVEWVESTFNMGSEWQAKLKEWGVK